MFWKVSGRCRNIQTITLKDWLESNKDWIYQTFEDLHDLAEVSWKEEKTRDYLITKLNKFELSYQTFENHCGVVASWQGKKEGPTAAIRTDMDALWQPVNGEWKANHSCGHDAHMTMVLSAIKCLKEMGFKPEYGNFKIIFQPAEETGKGALAMVEDGVLEDVDYLLGIHVRPKIELRFGQASPAIYHGAATLLKGKVTGVQAHGSRPNQGVNVVDAIGAIISAVNGIKVDPTVPSSAKVTQINAGGTNINLIPDQGDFSIDIRAQKNEVMDELLNKVNRAVKGAGEANGSKVSLDPVAKMAASIPNQRMERHVRAAITDVLGENGVVDPPVTPGGEDFHFYPLEKEGLHATMIGLGTDLVPGLHHPDMKFNHHALENGAAILARTVLELFEEEIVREENSNAKME
ncbi:M20 peptidase aminoacylase family protein [Thalassobacillus devorans]|uniref:M20 peptidase aminoacylase family protein n=1 Tax=Thalassobacillus devorans TaxID=279813 RepID=UPI000A1CF1CA|nr:M20 peptidase aminoacylase family protein [Thalassobacillus devorans]